MNKPKSILTKSQFRDYLGRTIHFDGEDIRVKCRVRYDDQCHNGYNTFSITGEHTRVGDSWENGGGGCCHDQIAAAFPELAPFIKWHLCSADGPMYYIENTVYLAGDRDCHGLQKDERKQLRNGKTGALSWRLEATAELPKYIDSDTIPEQTAILRYVPWERIGEGKLREFEAARRTAVWPEVTDEELSVEPEQLKARLLERLPALIVEFKKDVESLGFTY